MLPAALILASIALQSPPVVPSATTTPSAEEVADAKKRAVSILLAAREAYVEGSTKKGEAKGSTTRPKSAGAGREWPYEGVYRVGGEIPIGYRIGGTSIVATALLAAADGAPEGDARAAVLGALDFVLEALRDPRMSTDFTRGYDVRGWGHAYALDFLLALRAAKLAPDARKKAVDRAIQDLVKVLDTTAIGERGGWNYSRPAGAQSDPSTFMTAATLIALYEARRQGEDVDPRTVERALRTLSDARLSTGAFQYGSDPDAHTGRGIEDVPGAAGRMTVCEVALHLAGAGDVDRIRASVAAFFEHWSWLEQRRKKTGTHEGPYKIAPYYFYFAHRHAAQGIEFLPEAEREPLRARLRELLWRVREESGGWNDRVFPRSESFGTAMTLLALLEPERARPAGWPAPDGAKEGR